MDLKESKHSKFSLKSPLVFYVVVLPNKFPSLTIKKKTMKGIFPPKTTFNPKSWTRNKAKFGTRLHSKISPTKPNIVFNILFYLWNSHNNGDTFSQYHEFQLLPIEMPNKTTQRKCAIQITHEILNFFHHFL